MEQVRIMVVDDESIIALDIKGRLERLGYHVVAVCHSGAEAVQQAGENLPDLVLMDIRMPGEIDGIEAANQIREQHAVPVVFVTAYSDEATLERVSVTDPFGYILKPFEDRNLHATIAMALYKHRAEQELTQRLREVTGLNSLLQSQLEEYRPTIEVLRDMVVMLDNCRQEVDRLLEQARAALQPGTASSEEKADVESNNEQ